MSVTPVVVFDVLGTVFPLTPVGDLIHSLLTRELTRLEASPTTLTSLPSPQTLTTLLYAELIKEAVCLSYAQFYTPLPTLTPLIVQRLVTRYLHQHTPHSHAFTLTTLDHAHLTSTLSTLPPHPLAPPLIDHLSRFATLLALSNGSTASTTALLTSAHLLPHFRTPPLSADTARCTKPDANVYALVTPGLGRGVGVYFVSAHAFDVHGVLRWNAVRKGVGEGKVGGGGEEGEEWVTVWVSDVEREWLDVGDGEGGARGRPHLIAKNLTEAGELIGQHYAEHMKGSSADAAK